MTQYVLQISNDTQQLIKSYTVTADCPERPEPEGRTQAIITDTNLFNDVVAAYREYKLRMKCSWDGANFTWVIE